MRARSALFNASFLFLFLACSAFSNAWAANAPASGYEQPISLRASMVLPRELLKGAHYTIDENVHNDGYMNTFFLHSQFGDMQATSTALLMTRIDEINAMVKMQQIHTGNEFGKGLVQGGKSVVDGAKNLVTDPLDTIGSAVSGVGKLFSRANEKMTGNSASKYEEDTLSNVTGFARTKREYAKAFGVDPYSTNPIFQKALDDVARAGYAGGITAMALKAMIPGGIGLAVSSVSGVNWFNQFDIAQPPTELHRQNREKLQGMGMSSELVSLFLEDDEYTPTQQTLLVLALAKMPDVGGRDAVIRLSARANSQGQTLFRQRSAQMFAGYHRGVARLERFEALEKHFYARTSAGKLVLCFPVDYMVWGERLARAAQAFTAKAGGAPIEMWISGQLTPKARKGFQDLKWQIHERAGKQLLGEKL